jgi:hypothetical protein
VADESRRSPADGRDELRRIITEMGNLLADLKKLERDI